MEITNDTGLKVGWCIGRVPPYALSATLLVKGTFRIVPDGPAEPLPEDEQADLSGDLHLDDDTERALIYTSDFALAKPNADILLAGHAHAPGGRPVTALKIGLQVGACRRALLVVGPRAQGKGLLGKKNPDPEPFTSMPLTWEQCYGGPGFASNPLGQGLRETLTETGDKVRPFPNLLRPEEAGAGIGQKQEPAGVGPIPMMWPQRLSRVGTYDKAWLEKNWPWFPDDFDWTFFNSAPPEQQLKEFLKGDEPFSFEHLHPELENLAGRLPGLRVRWFVVERNQDAERFREIPMHLDTVWVEPDTLKLVLVWRGVLEAHSKQLREVVDHYIVREKVEEPPATLAHYAVELPIRKAILAQEVDDEEEAGQEGAADAFAFAPVELPSSGWEDKLEAEFAEAEKTAEQLAAQSARQHETILKALALQGLKPPPPPSTKPPTDMEYLKLAQDAWDRAVKLKPELAEEMPRPDDPDFGVKIPDIDAELPADEDEAPDEDDIKWTRELVVEAVAAGRGLVGRELNGLDLSGLELAGVDLTEAVLEGANLDGADLTGACMDRCLLPGASLVGARLGQASLKRADLTGAKLDNADLTGSNAAEADFSGVTLVGADLTGMEAAEALFVGADLTEARLPRCRMAGADFDGAVLTGADFSEARLEDASFTGASGHGIKMPAADLTGLRAAGADFTDGIFTKARGTESIWEGATLDRADMTTMILTRANFETAHLHGTRFTRSLMRHARLPEADLTGADLRQVNLFRGNLEGAHLEQTDFRGANLYEVEFYQASVKGGDFRDANVKRTKLA